MRWGLRALHNRDYRIYALGGVVSNLGTWMHRIAQGWLVLLVSDSNGVVLGTAAALQFAPTLLLAPVAGHLADRWDRRRLLQTTQAGMAVASLILGILAIGGTATTPTVLMLIGAFGVVSAFDAPVRHAFVGTVVGRADLPSAVAINSISFNSARAIGSAIAGGLIAAMGSGISAAGWIITLNAFSYIPVLLSIQMIALRKPEPQDAMSLPPPNAPISTLDHIRRSPTALVALMGTGIAALFGSNIENATLLMITKVLVGGAEEFGVAVALFALGALIGALMSARRQELGLRYLFLALLILGVFQIAAGLSTSTSMFLIVAPVMGFASMQTLTTANTIVQLGSPAKIRGRVMAAYSAILTGGIAVWGFALGSIAEIWSARVGFVAGGTALILGAILCWFVNRRRRMNG